MRWVSEKRSEIQLSPTSHLRCSCGAYLLIVTRPFVSRQLTGGGTYAQFTMNLSALDGTALKSKLNGVDAAGSRLSIGLSEIESS
jgi:hypothetical protein